LGPPASGKPEPACACRSTLSELPPSNPCCKPVAYDAVAPPGRWLHIFHYARSRSLHSLLLFTPTLSPPPFSHQAVASTLTLFDPEFRDRESLVPDKEHSRGRFLSRTQQ